MSAQTVTEEVKKRSAWSILMGDAAACLLLGILILAKCPSSSVWAIGTLFGVSVLMSEIFRIMIAKRIRRSAAALDRLARTA